jgi:hypothetical protein
MCKVSNKIKFCTCVDDNIDIEELNHYWVLHRYNKDKNMNVMGEPIFPDNLHPMFIINEALLIYTLNKPDAFDKNIELKKGDRLEVALCNNSDNDSLYYNFKFTGKTWISIESDSFDLMSNFDELKSGKIKEIAMNKYGTAAINAAKENKNPIESWNKAVKDFDSESAKVKGCPKNTFLGLCEEGLVKGIPKGNYTKSVKNKEYALKAVAILKQNTQTTFSPKELWEKLELGDKRSNSQMDVVLALWENGLIVK